MQENNENDTQLEESVSTSVLENTVNVDNEIAHAVMEDGNVIEAASPESSNGPADQEQNDEWISQQHNSSPDNIYETAPQDMSIETQRETLQEQPGNVENTISVTASIVKDGRTKNQKLVDEIFKPNSDGKSDWITRETLIKSDLNFSDNGNQRHGAFFKDDRFIWDSKRGKRNTVLALRTNGFQDYKLIQKNWPKRPDIKAHYKKMACVFCGQHSELVCDHKNDIYNDPRVQNRKTQTMDDFQSCCNGCNLRKRQVAIVRNRTGKRIGATTIPSMAVFGIDFTEGDDTYDETDVNAMVGTYWFDPIAFNKKIKGLLASQLP
jgi:5-methylcytosine-specific restriction endonuclease McrA